MMDDLISRKAAIEAIDGMDTEGGMVSRGAVKMVLDHLKGVQPKRAGKWKGTQTAECDQCGHVYPVFMRFQNFCPSCGADMQGGKA